jgi:hypothetical protein
MGCRCKRVVHGIAGKARTPMIVFLPKHFAEVNFNPDNFPESEDDMPPVLPETMSVNVTPALVKVQPDQKLIFTNDKDQFPTFEIKFLAGSPASPADDLTGSEKVTIHVKATGTFPYVVIHTPAEGDALVTGPFSIRSCTGGCP